MSQNSDAPEKQNEKNLQTSVDLDFLQSSLKPTNQYPYVLSLPNPFGFNQDDIDSSSRSISNPAPELTNTIGQNLTLEGDIANPFGVNQHDIDSSSRSISNPAPELSYTIDQNVPSEGDIANSNNRVVIPSRGSLRTHSPRANYPRGRMSGLMRGLFARREVVEGENMETNYQHPNIPPWRTIQVTSNLMLNQRAMFSASSIQAPSNPFVLNQPAMISASSIRAPSELVLNQHNMFSASRPMFNSAPGLSFTMCYNLPPPVYNINTNRPAIPSIRNPRGRGSRARYPRGRMPRLMRGSFSRPETNRQYPNAPLSIDTTRNPERMPIRNITFENVQPVDPTSHLTDLNLNFGYKRDNK
ncbi:hypothetical protein RDI58_028460 [Solanum bulbocastanum]|uniref:Uncharacterized protein n=1 Tax=Solanum bulbocastanum TaxID=147425 RepID=A0AAN8SV19_SOLBU